MSNIKKVELLSPAGNIEGFYGAISAGADAVYLAGEKYGARAYADNFSTEQIIECIRYAHLFGRKVYLTVNTLIKEKEFDELYDYLIPFYEAGLDAVIVQDIGVFQFIKEHFPGLILHVSTQMTITGVHGASLLKKMGAERIVPARELNLTEIKEIKEYTGMELECFIHGAMCYCYSGQCLFSSILGGRSGNRGRCAQPCRLPYSVDGIKKGQKECYPLSLKDMCTIEHIDKLIEAGIDSFKIEGRMKKPEYTAGVTAIYRKYIDAYYKYGHSVKVSDEDMKVLTSLYIRSERETGYYFRRNGKEMVSLNNPAYSGSDEKILQKIRNDYLQRMPKIAINMKGEFHTGTPCKLTLIYGKDTVTVTGAQVEQAQNQPLSIESITKQLNKLGESVFSAESIDVSVKGDIFIPLKEINELRRKAVKELENTLVSRRITQPKENIKSLFDAKQSNTKGSFVVSVQTYEQLKAVAGFYKDNRMFAPGRIYINSDIVLNKNAEEQIIPLLKELGEDCLMVLSLPYILRSTDKDYLLKLKEFYLKHTDVFCGFQIRSMEALGFLVDNDISAEIFADAGFYAWNLYAINSFKDTIACWCLPFELKEGEQRALKKSIGMKLEKVVYGRIPMMITANCVNKTVGEKCEEKTLYLSDRYNKKFPVRTVCKHCMNIIYNSVPLSLHSSVSKEEYTMDMRIDFTLEGQEEIFKILGFFHSIQCGENKVILPPYKEYTTGHEKRGVE